MKTHLPKLAAVLMATVFATPYAAKAVPVVMNASFEAPALAATSFSNSYTYNPTGAGWTFSNYAGISANGGPFYSGAAPDGLQAGFLQNAPGASAGSISQTITGLVIGQNYSVTFSLAARDGYAVNPIDVMLGGVDLGTYMNTGLAFVTEITSNYTATGTSALLAFTGTGTSAGENDAAIDAVSVNQIASLVPTSVPEPASMALLGLGVAAVAAVRRRKFI